jgi:DNA repair protein RecN (Recombination protein N)
MKTNKLILNSLTLNNFATFDNQVINFKESFNTIVGETGSGKSLILDALQLVFGNRADKKIIRKGSEFSTVEAVFTCEDHEIKNYFQDIGHPYSDNEIIIKRVINSEGSSKAYLNFQQCSLSTLNSISKRYIDLVGQFDNQKLLSEDYQLKLLDDYSNINLKEYTNSFQDLKSLELELHNLKEENKTKSQRKDYLEFQINELSNLSPSVEVEKSLIQKKEEILDIQRKSQSFTQASELLTDGNLSIITQLNKLISKVNKNNLLPEKENELLLEASEALDDISFYISKKNQSENSQDEIQSVIEELDSYQKAKRKFNCTTEELENIFSTFKEEYERIENTSERLVKIEEKIKSLREQCWNMAQDIHDKRKVSAKNLSRDLTLKVQNLRMNGATLNIQVNDTESLNRFGFSSISFMAQTNPGEGFFKIKEIASGGELSRILLSLRQILSQGDTISVFLFDEIDTGIGGETAISIGKALSEVSLNSQVIAITHLPQIAKFSDHLIDVNKKESKSRTFSFTTIINEKNKKQYIRDMAQL